MGCNRSNVSGVLPNMRRTNHKGTEVVANVVTWAMIRAHADAFTGFSPRAGTLSIGAVWNMGGPTAREGLLDTQVIRIVAATTAQNISWTGADIHAIRRAFFEECEAQGIGVYDREPFFSPEVK
jgi:hypothetical protein